MKKPGLNPIIGETDNTRVLSLNWNGIKKLTKGTKFGNESKSFRPAPVKALELNAA